MTPTAAPLPAPPRGPVPATRRGLLLGGAGLGLLLVGCSSGTSTSSTRDGSVSPASTAAPDGAQDGAQETTDDADRVAEAREALAAAATLVTAAQRSVPSLRGVLAPLLALHEAHAEALGQPLDLPRAARRAAPADPLLALVRDREEQLRVRLADLSVAADSGSLARLLGSMSAGLAQRLAVLPSTAPVTAAGRGAGAGSGGRGRS